MNRRPGIEGYRDYRAPLYLTDYSLGVRERLKKHLRSTEERVSSPSESGGDWGQPFGLRYSGPERVNRLPRERIHQSLHSSRTAATEYGQAIAGRHRRNRMGARQWAERIFLTIGLLCLALWLGSIAVTRVYQAWDTRAFEREMHEMRATRAIERPGLPPAQAPKLAANELVGRLIIPRLHLSEVVREGDSDGILRLALGHIPNTPLPGQNGNVAVAGHRDTLFRGLRNIRKNDLIVFETATGRFEYRVQSTEIVRPQQVSVLDASADPELTLVTCYPFFYVGPAPKRFIVKARQIGGTGPPSQVQGS